MSWIADTPEQSRMELGCPVFLALAGSRESTSRPEDVKEIAT
jgi:hypothetical protein